MPDALYFTGDQEANELIATEPLALLIGFVLDQQVPVPTAFSGPLKLKQRLGRLDAAELAGLDPDRLDAIFREKPAIHRFPGSMAKRVQELAAVVAEDYGGDASSVWRDVSGTDDLKRRLEALPRIRRDEGEGARVGARAEARHRRRRAARPEHPMLGDVDSPETLAEYQAAKRAYKASLRAES